MKHHFYPAPGDYDEEGRVTWTIEYINGLGYKTAGYTYDAMGRLTKKVYQKNTAAETFVHYYEYDPANGQLWKVHTNTVDNPGTKMLQATYVYYLHGPLKRVELASDLQGIDYTYTLQGALKAINNNDKTKDPGGDGTTFKTDAFGMVLDYYPNDYVNSRTTGIQAIKGVNTSSIVTTESYAGNIKAMSWFSKKPAVVLAGNPNAENPTAYVFNYDDKYQFTESTWGTGLNFANTPATFTSTGFNKERIEHPTTGVPAYDANGNIQYLQRYNTTGAVSDKFTYNYTTNTNRLSSVVHDNNGTNQTYASYTYDEIGQLEYESSLNPANSRYIYHDATGKVHQVARDAAFTNKIAVYNYDEMGQRMSKRHYNATGDWIQTTVYIMGNVYTAPVSGGVVGAYTLQEQEIDGGMGRIGTFYRPTSVYAYEMTDHLGNVRAVIAKNAGNLEVRMYTDYYPYGMTIQSGGTNYRYQYQGQYAEKDAETDWNAFELRMYDSRIARWLSVDPKGEFHSPYLAMGNSPTGTTDPDGGSTDDWYQNNTTGEIKWINGSGEQKGYTHLGEDLTFTFTSFIDGNLWDGPMGNFPAGDKLTSKIFVDATQDAKGNLLSVNVTSNYNVGATGGIFGGRDYFPGLGGGQNKAINIKGATSFNATFEQHASVNGFEALGLNMMGYDIVNVAQRINIGLNSGHLSIIAATDIFPSAALSVNGNLLMRYNQPSFAGTHGRVLEGYRDSRSKFNDAAIPIYRYLRPAPNFTNRFKN